MAKYSMKVKGKEVGSAEVYAAPHTMTGKDTSVATYSGGKSVATLVSLPVIGYILGRQVRC